jgi:hypothetical protein
MYIPPHDVFVIIAGLLNLLVELIKTHREKLKIKK